MTIDASMLTIKVTLDHVEPPVWRRFSIRSDAHLTELHEVVQDVMGWEDRHLHMFVAGSGQRYAMTVSLDEWDDGTEMVEDGVRVDTLLVAVGDRLEYEYDFGDGWTHSLVLEAVGDGRGASTCLAGERACPPEDCGGPHGYEDMLAVLADPDDLEFHHMQSWAGEFDSEQFEVTEALGRIAARRENAELTQRVRQKLPKLGSILERGPLEYHPRLAHALRHIDMEPGPVDPVVAAVAMEKLTWTLARVGTNGLKLTAAGYLAPKDVVAIRDELEWGREWIGDSNREVDNLPVHWLRAAVTQLGLVRVLKGRLVRTRSGTSLATDPVALWTHAAARLPVGREQHEKDAGLLLLAAVAASSTDAERNSLILQSMEVVGWIVPDRELRFPEYLARPTLEFLRLIGAVPSGLLGTDVAPDWGRVLAVHALSES